MTVGALNGVMAAKTLIMVVFANLLMMLRRWALQRSKALRHEYQR